MNISKSSLLYHFLTTYGKNYVYVPNNTCDLISDIVVACVAVFMISVTGGIVAGFTVGEVLAWSIASIVSGQFLPIGERFWATIVLFVIFGTFAIIAIIKHTMDNRAFRFIYGEVKRTKAESVVYQLYDGIRNKFCVAVKVVD